MKALFDTHILMDYLRGIPAAREEMQRYKAFYVSAVTWIELTTVLGADALNEVESFLGYFTQLPCDKAVTEAAADLQPRYRLPVPQTIVMATALAHHIPLVTRGAHPYPKDHPLVRTAY
jgi:predicted nucleic acid-binding protein